MKTETKKEITFAEIWKTLSAVDCSKYTTTKTTGGAKLTYLSWAWAWTTLMKYYPTATFTIREWDGKPWLHSAAGYLVETSVEIEGHERGMWLPVMDSTNNAMKDEPYTFKTKFGERSVAAVDMMAINKTIMRCLVKNLAMFGLGLYIYAGEDLPEGEESDSKTPDLLGASKSAQITATKPSVAKPRTNTSPEALTAWRTFRALPLTAKMNDQQKSESFRALIENVTGKKTSGDLNPDEWKKVFDAVKDMEAK